MILSTPQSIEFLDLDGRVIAAKYTLAVGWNLLSARIGLGAWVWDDCMLVCNACPGAGILNFARIRITFRDGTRRDGVPNRFAWQKLGETDLLIGNGHECMVPRGCFVVRWNWDYTAPAVVPYFNTAVHWHPSQRQTISINLTQDRGLGLYQPAGENDTAPPGATNRGSIVGWEQDGPGLVLRSDLLIERSPLACLDPNTGMPLIVPHADYDGVRGWTQTTQLPIFCKPLLSPNSTGMREPRVSVRGTCDYTNQLLGIPRNTSYGPFDNQHLGNLLTGLIAAAQCDDECARFFLAVVANDTRITKLDPVHSPNGSRQLAWSMESLLHWEPTWDMGRQLAVRVEEAQTPSGAVLRAPANYPFSPTPQSYGMPADYDSDQTMERILTCIPLGRLGYVDFVRKCAEGMPWPPTKFLGVGRNQTEIFEHYEHACGDGDFFGDILIGLGMLLQPRDHYWASLALQQPVPGTSYENFVPYENLGARLAAMKVQTQGREQSAVLRALLERKITG